jgi:hypothetical protein
MIRRNKKTRKYLSPRVVSTDLALESNFCNTNLQFGDTAVYLDEWHNMNAETGETVDDGTYFDF